jgi:hypothetical protein
MSTLAEPGEKPEEGKKEKPCEYKKRIHATAVKRFGEAEMADQENRRNAVIDLEMLQGIGHWDAQVAAARNEAKRPCLTINKLPQFLQQVVGDLRRNNFSINVIPVDDDADPALAKLREGVIRHIQTQSKAEMTYFTAGEMAAACGYGAWRVLTRWADETSFDLDIYIDLIANPFTVFFGPHKNLDASDAQYCFLAEMTALDELTEEYPDADPSDWNAPTGTRNEGWWRGDKIRIAEYFWIEEEEGETLLLLSDGETTSKAVWDSLTPEEEEALEANGLTVVSERVVETRKVMWAKMSGAGVIDGPKEWPSRYIPVVPVKGMVRNIEGKIYVQGIVRNGLDAQRAYNYFRSAAAEVVGLQPKSPFIADQESIEGLESFWRSANTENLPYLPYNSKGGTLPPPKRSEPPQGSAALFQQIMNSDSDIKDSIGLHEATLGKRSNETSGVAIAQRQQQGDSATFAYHDNLRLSVEQTGRILLDMIPKVYGNRQTLRIIGANDETQVVQTPEVPDLDETGAPLMDPATGQPVMKKISLDEGKYDLILRVGPSNQSAREESLNTLFELVKAWPAVTPLIADLIVKNTDIKEAPEIEKRLKMANPMLNQQQPPPEPGGPNPVSAPPPGPNGPPVPAPEPQNPVPGGIPPQGNQSIQPQPRMQ